MNIVEWIWIGMVPTVMVLGILLKQFIPKLSVQVFAVLFAIVSTEMLFYTVFKYSGLSYLGLLFTVIGLIMLIYNYKINHFYTVKQFLWRWLYAFSNIMILVWGMMSIYRIVLMFMK